MKYEPLKTGHFYHIYNRGNNREDIFIEPRNYSHFLKLMQKYLLPTSDIYAYCLMKNHFHLAIKAKEEVSNKDISKSFSNLFNAYAKAINKAYQRTGSLFQDRFSRKSIQDEDYLRNPIIYVNTNAQYHDFVSDFKDYPYCSYRDIVMGNNVILCHDTVTELFGDKQNFIYCHEQKKNTIETSLENIDY